MLKSHIKALVVVASLIWSGMACAVGFGGANVASALGQPLKVEISLVAVSDADKSSLAVRMASPDAFKAAGLDYPYHLSKLKFEIDTRNGQPYIKVTSKESVNDPFISLLVELSWSSGRLMREYTFLLDPPDYKAEQPKAEEVTPIEPVIAAAPVPEAPQAEPIAAVPASAPAATTAEAPPAATAEVAAASAPEAAVPAPVAAEAASEPVATTAEAPQAAVPETEASSSVVAVPLSVPEPAPQTAAAPTTTEKPWVAKETIKVKRGDTLSKIAAQVQEPDVTLEQMLVALYRANANKFDGRNMNRLRAGKILTVPDQAVLEKLSQKEAVKEIRIQTNNWNAYKQKLAAASTPAPEQAPKQEAAGKISTSVADKTPAVKESAKEVLKLSKGEAPGDNTAAAGKAQTQENKAHAKEEAIAKEKAAQESSTRAAMLEKNVKDMKKLVELKGGVPTAASSVAAASGVQAAKPVARPKVVPVAATAEPSMLDEILDSPILKDPIYLGGGAAILLGLGGLGFFLVRRNRGSSGRSSKKKSLISMFSKKK